MAGETFLAGQQKTRPGVYVRVTNAGLPQKAVLPSGIVAALFRSSWGPLGKATEITDVNDVDPTFGTASTATTAVIKEAFYGNAKSVQAYRLGSGGTAASLTLNDTTAGTPVQVVKLTFSYVGVDGNNYKATLQDSLTDTTKRELILYNGTEKVLDQTFAKGGTEPDSLVSVVNGLNLAWLTATKLAAGNGTMAAVSQTAFSGGADPTVASSDYSTALNNIATVTWNVLATDSEDSATHATIQSYIDSQRNSGKLVRAVVGEPTSVALATRQTDSKAFNDYAMHYVLNGFQKADGTNVEGYKAAARVAGMIASASITDSLTHALVTSATDLVGPLANDDIINSINAGAITFTKNAQGQIQIEYGINTFVTTDANHDAGWKKIRRVSERDYLMSEITSTWDPLVGKVNNDPTGRATLIAVAQNIINSMVKLGALLSGTIKEDTANPPSGDSSWFVVSVDDTDSAEHVYMNFGFEFSPSTSN